jgi:hypothetical protein
VKGSEVYKSLKALFASTLFLKQTKENGNPEF